MADKNLRKLKNDAEAKLEAQLEEWADDGLHIHQIRIMKHEDGDISVAIIPDHNEY